MELEIPKKLVGIFTERIGIYFTGLRYRILRIPAFVIMTKTREDNTWNDEDEALWNHKLSKLSNLKSRIFGRRGG